MGLEFRGSHPLQAPLARALVVLSLVCRALHLLLPLLLCLPARERPFQCPPEALCGGISKVNFRETLSSFGDKCPQNVSKNEQTAPRTSMGCRHVGSSVGAGRRRHVKVPRCRCGVGGCGAQGRESVGGRVCVRESVCVCVRERERMCVCVRESESVRQRESVCVCVPGLRISRVGAPGHLWRDRVDRLTGVPR